ncbi:MAG: hypothetical protein ACLP9C_07075 [Acidimicrobiales bacterium]
MAHRTLDIFVFGPAGMLLTAVEDLPEFAAKGRRRLTTHIRNARTVGEFVVKRGQHELERRMAEGDEPAPRGGRPVPGMRAEAPSMPAPGAEEPAAPGASVAPGVRGPEAATPTREAGARARDAGPQPSAGRRAPAPVPPGGAAGAPVDLAIPDYEALSASQVVRRLDGLGPGELGAVYRHEAATRRRRTILHRAQQLLGAEDPPGVPGPTA